MSPVKTFVMAGAVLCPLILSAAVARAATPGWTNGQGAVSGFADVDRADRALVGSVESTGAGRAAAGSPAATAAAACRWLVGYAAAEQLVKPRPESIGLVDVERVEADGGRSRMYARICDGRIVGWAWLRVPNVSGAVASAAREVRRRLPAPRGRFSPDVAGAAVVRVSVWFAVPGQWSAVSASAQIPGASVTVTAAPTVLRFAPGDGSPPVSCVGPGPVFVPGTPEPARPPACSYTYRDASTAAPGGRFWPGVLAIDWTVAWSASDGEHGTLPGITTRAEVPVEVREIEAVERAGR
ncbi:hypothetical protein ThrDRAFT_03234 [Frankia casuarinae]|uniref:TonB C-terminal domain-containing protein n=1 Tax=Frankia casuarinae (strain DSM 45818 / CECT 9043 / HFP020203 / CcI3) TaxID=106370 RepID=Q2J7Q1_FRACC|nr:hypothetical protein Francci3_3334 [Frankia casuarinae]EYT91132.1 hypothetical protein ThrDRAFT_03234 [Frankia casuarinae]KDA41619.1 hypothetical protein BMG523Draft_03557 [Frankia sp. BMG5.23]